MKIAMGLLLALAIGIACRLAGIPVPAPPVLIGALLVLAMSAGYVATDYRATHRKATTKNHCGGPTGETRVQAMIDAIIGLLLGFAIGAGCRWFDLPLPAPPRLVGALLVVAMTLGFWGTSAVLGSHRRVAPA